MAKPLTVSLSHDLGRAEAIRRITDGIGYLKEKHANLISVLEDRWDANQLTFAVSTLKQTARGTVLVEDDRVTLTVTLPFLLAMMAEKAQALIQKEGTLLLERK